MRNPSKLHLYGMGLQSLSARIESFQNLRVLNLRGNYLEDLPKELYSLPMLVTLDASENFLTGLQGLEVCLARIQEVNLSENLINEAGMLPVLEHVNISGNPLGTNFSLEVASFLKGNIVLANFQMVKVPLNRKSTDEILMALTWNYNSAIFDRAGFWVNNLCLLW